VNLTLDGNGTSAFDKCIFLGNLAQTGGAICLNRNLATFTNCTFVDNEAPNGSSIYNRSYNTVPVSNTVIAFGDSPPIVCEEGSRGVEIVCTNIYANTGGDWVGCIADQYGQNGNISLDPLFCDTANGDYSLYNFSPCAAANNSCGQLIGAFDVGCNLATTIALPDETDSLHVKSHMPHLAWAFEPASLFQQTEYEVELGSDNDWAVAEVWDPDVVVTGLSELVYQGPELLDGATYYVRLRTKLNGVWSPWYETSFRMNSLPGAPTVATPLADAVTGAQPSLYVYHSTDAEGDPVQYQFEVYLVSQPPQQVAVSELVDEQADSTGWTVWAVLEDNATYWWHGRAWDGYEYSEWSISRFFSVNTLPQAPSNPSLVAPMGEDLILYDMLPTFNWTVAADPDPGDQVHYRLELSLNQNFTLVVPFDNIAQTSMQVPDSLEFNTRYWWRVKAVDLVGLFGVSEPADFWTWTLGDVNYDHDMTLGDIMILVDHLFISGIAITPPKAGDVNHDCEITLGDIMIMVDNLFISGAELQVGCEL
jgi:hypothetical protein